MFEEVSKQKNKKKVSRTIKEVQNFQRELASIFSREQKKKIAPPSPALTNFDQRINSLRDFGKRRGKRYSIIGISASVLITIVVCFLSYMMVRELVNINNKIDERKEMFDQVIADRELDCNSNCCLESLKIIKQNNYIKANFQGECPEGYNANGLRCEDSLIWCQLP